MRNALLLGILLALSYDICGLTLEDIIRLSQSQVDEEVIVSIIKSSDTRWELGIDDIILLKNQGVSPDVIIAIIEKSDSESTEKGRERTAFDEFFLSPYYSHQYGWPEPNYASPREILESGLFYQPPDNYPDARWTRVYGWNYAYDRRRQVWQSSPYSLIVPKKKKKCYGTRPARSIRENTESERLTPVEEKAMPAKTGKVVANLPIIGEWYQALAGAMDTLDAQIRQVRLSEATPQCAKMQDHIQKIRQYPDTLKILQDRIKEQNKRRNFAEWIAIKAKSTPYLEEQYSLYALKAISSQGRLNLGVEDEVMEIILSTADLQRDIKDGQLRDTLENILSRLTIIHHKFADLYLRMDKAVVEFESGK